MYGLFPGEVGRELKPIVDGVDFEKVFKYKEASGLTDEEWEMVVEATERTESAAEDEDNRGSARSLLRFQQFKNQAFGDRPLSVVRCNMAADFWKQYDAGVKVGNGTEDERVKAREFIEKLQSFDDELRASQLRLSSRNRYVHHPHVGHAFVITRPELLVDEVHWILGQLSGK